MSFGGGNDFHSFKKQKTITKSGEYSLKQSKSSKRSVSSFDYTKEKLSF